MTVPVVVVVVVVIVVVVDTVLEYYSILMYLLPIIFSDFKNEIIKAYLQSMTKTGRLASPDPLFNVGFRFACSFLA